MSESAPKDRLGTDEVADLGLELGAIVDSGLPLPAGLRALASELPRARTRRVLLDLVERTERGEPIDAALAAVGQRLPGALRGLIVVGLRTGQLPLVLEQYVEASRRARGQARQIWSALAYPLLLLLCVTVVLLFLFAYLVPQFQSLYDDFEMTLPLWTLLLLQAAPSLKVLMQAILIVAGLVPGLLLTVGRTQLGRRLQRRVPLFGCLWCWAALAQWYRLLALMMQHAVPAASAARLLAQSVEDPVLRSGSAWLAHRIEAGEPLSTALAERTDVWGRVGSVLQWAEKRSLVPETLVTLAGMLERRCFHHAAFLRAATPTALFLLVMFMVGSTVIALVAPLVKLLVDLGRG
jgi:general secretion pathway protein F